eukprot:GHVP01024709.1.p1 GENE.GHVP01024709.1~~GHVP01024709.1.p1  ORF type:complete len:103 (+),score=14.52 GHVP01024709.1:422-730(+)
MENLDIEPQRHSLQGHSCLLPLVDYTNCYRHIPSKKAKFKKFLENEALEPDSAESWNFYTDASDSGFGAVLNDPSGKLIANLSLENRLHLPISEFEMLASTH